MIAVLAFVGYIILFPGDDGTEALRAKGYPTTLEELDAWYPEPPPGENAAEFYMEAGTQLSQSTYEDLEWIPLFGEVELPPLGVPIPDDMIADIEAFIAYESDAFVLIDEARLLDSSRYPTKPGPGAIDFLPVIKGSRGQQLRALLHCARGETDKALDEFAKLSHWSQTLNNEPSLTGIFLLDMHVQFSVETVERFLNDNDLSNDDFSKLDSILDEMIREDTLLRGFVGERCIMMDTILKSNSIISNYARGSYAGMADAFIAIAESGLPEALPEYNVLRNHEFSILQMYEKVFIPGFRSVVVRFYDSSARVTTARAAIAIEKLRVNGGELPANREAMTESMKAVWPIDPFSGNPLGYKRVDEGYIVYSVGRDFEDNGGDLTHGQDTVFRVLR